MLNSTQTAHMEYIRDLTSVISTNVGLTAGMVGLEYLRAMAQGFAGRIIPANPVMRFSLVNGVVNMIEFGAFRLFSNIPVLTRKM